MAAREHQLGHFLIGFRLMFGCQQCLPSRARGLEGVPYLYWLPYDGIGFALAITDRTIEAWFPFVIVGVNRDVQP